MKITCKEIRREKRSSGKQGGEKEREITNKKESGTTSTGNETRKRPVIVTVLHRINQSTE